MLDVTLQTLSKGNNSTAFCGSIRQSTRPNSWISTITRQKIHLGGSSNEIEAMANGERASEEKGPLIPFTLPFFFFFFFLFLSIAPSSTGYLLSLFAPFICSSFSGLGSCAI
jgi:hypothetical protein